ncbi:MAG: 3-methyl-2-oxobutanoate hydroxymethyltransferase [Bacteroidales bacterium]
MSVHNDMKKKTAVSVRNMKGVEKISVLTAYDFTMASIMDAAGIDVLLVGDSAANVVAGYNSTLPITLDHLIYHGQSVMRGVKQALVVIDLPFGTYQACSDNAVDNAVKMLKAEAGEAVKLEGGEHIAETIRRIVDAGIPVMGHLGLTPQSVNNFGGYKIQAKSESEAKKLIDDAKILEQAGCFSIVLEKVPAEVAKTVTQSISIPTIGIGAGVNTDGQVLVSYDMLGLTQGFNPKFLRRFANLGEQIKSASQEYIKAVKTEDFPNITESY